MMNALRTLPILNRPSRPSSPAPPSTQTTTATAVAQPHTILGLGITHTASEPGKPRSRSLSRQVADRVSSMHVSTQINGHAVTPSQPVGKKGPSPPGSRPVTPRITQTALPADTGAGAPQGVYMDVLGLRLNEAVNKACAGVDFKAKKGFKKGMGWSVGESVVKELPYPPSDAYLIRAVLRTSVRSLSIYITRLESLLLPALTDPLFGSQLNLSLPTYISHPLNHVQYFAISVAHAAWESCEVLEQTLETGDWPRFVSETLRPVMDKLDLVVGKVVQPLLRGLKRDLVASLSHTEGLSPAGGKPVGLAHTPAPTSGPVVTVTKETSNAPISRLTKESSQGGHARQLPVPVALQHFASRVDGARKVLELVAAPCADDGEGWVTSLIVAVVWKGMCVISEKDIAPSGTRPPSPGSVARALHNVKLEREGTMPPPAISPSASLGGVTAKLTTMLPSRAVSRPPSPPRHTTKRWDPTTHALMSLEGLVKRLVTGLVEPSPTPSPNLSEIAAIPAPDHIAREALHEALEALASFRTVSAAMNADSNSSSSRILASSRRIRDDVDDDVEESLDDAMEDMPAVTILSILIRRANTSLSLLPIKEKTLDGVLAIQLPHEFWGWSVAEYDRQVLGGFAAAEEWGRRVALAIKPDVERVMSVLASMVAGSVSGGEKGVGRDVAEAQEWVRCLGVCCEARGGVKVIGAT